MCSVLSEAQRGHLTLTNGNRGGCEIVVRVLGIMLSFSRKETVLLTTELFT